MSHDGKKEQKDLSPVHSSQFSLTSNSETSEIWKDRHYNWLDWSLRARMETMWLEWEVYSGRHPYQRKLGVPESWRSEMVVHKPLC